jgi:hypothetical protein
MIRKIFKLTAGMVALLFAVLLLAGCGDDSYVNPSGGGDGSERITSLTSTPSEIQMGEEATITGMVVDSAGDAVANRQVVFAVDPSEAGYFLPAAVNSGSDGSFSCQFVPLDIGAISITATTSTEASASFSTQIMNSSGYQSGQWRFEFEVSPSFALADGAAISDVVVSIWDNDNEPVADGQVVKIEVGERFEDVDGDGYFTENVDYVLVDINDNEIWDRVGNVPKTVTTSSGSISFDYTAGTLAGLIYLRATIVDEQGSSFGEYPLVLRPSSEIASIALTSDRNEIQVKATGGIEFANLTAVCFDAYGNRVQSELPIDFFIVYGPGGGERLTVSAYNPDETSPDTLTSLTNVVGEATITMLSGIKSGTVMLQAKNGDVYSNSTLININAGPAYEISVGVDPCNIRGWDYVNIEADVVAIVNDVYGNPVADTTEIFFWTDEGMVEAASITEDGVGATLYHSGDPRDDGLAIIRAETAGGTVMDSTILIVSGPAVYVNILSYASDLDANGEDYTDIWVDARDINTNFMIDGTPIEILLTDGMILQGNLDDGCFGSLARIRYVAPTLNRDYSYTIPDDGIGRVVNGTVRVGGVNGPSAAIAITLHTGVANAKESDIDIEGTIAPGQTVPMDVVVADRSGNPLGGHLIVPSASMGTVAPASGYTNAYGEVAFRYTAPGAVGTAFVSAESQDPTYGGIIITKKVKIDVTD